MATTAPPATRHRTLDIVRGVAVIGILVINILSFALPEAARFDPTAVDAGLADRIVWAVGWVAFENKMRGLFSLLFGASLLVVADRARATGRPARAVQGPRLLVLLALGAAHGILIWDGDILVLYALVGVVALPFTRLDAEGLRRGAVTALAVAALMAATIGAGSYAMEREAAASPAAIEGPVAPHGATWTGEVRARAAAFPKDETIELVAFGPDTLGLMLLGMILIRSGLLTGGWERRRAVRLATWTGLAGAVPLSALVAWLWASGLPRPWLTVGFFALSYPFNIALTVAWAAGLSAWASAASGWLPRALEATGRMAFTNYIATSIVMTTIFYGYGGGLFGQVSRVGTLAFVALGAALMLGWSRPWLTRFSYGPLEWLWRSASRGRLQPMSRPALARR